MIRLAHYVVKESAFDFRLFYLVLLNTFYRMFNASGVYIVLLKKFPLLLLGHDIVLLGLGTTIIFWIVKVEFSFS